MVWQTGHLLQNGKYEILEVLGRGGFGLTYKARHRQLILEVVIKTPDILQKRDTEYEDYVKQFEAEGRKLAKFSQTPHSHIVRISDFFTEGQVPCLVMDFIQGQTLMEKVKAQGKLSEAECLKYIRQIGSALEVVHQAGMVHRDAHPGNIMIRPNGQAILIDFGIAKEIIPASSSSTNSGANFSFAPYEQVVEHIQSKNRALENITSNRKPSVDIYTLAATCYYAVTGQTPTTSIDRRLYNSTLRAPKEINRDLSDHLNTFITVGMALEKEDRPQSISDWFKNFSNSPEQNSVFKNKKNFLPLLITTFIASNMNGYRGYFLNVPSLSLIIVANVIMFLSFILLCKVTKWFVKKEVDKPITEKNIIRFTGTISGSFISPFRGYMTWVKTSFSSIVIYIFLIAFLVKISHDTLSFVMFSMMIIATFIAWTKLRINSSHSFLILAVTNLSGLASGWLLGFLLHSKG